jgi:tetratricopeptide (TPR) repeat protein
MPRFSLKHAITVALIAVGLLCHHQSEALAQITGGGSTENFKRPANPPVYHQPKVEPAGGRIKEDPNAKAGTKSAETNTPTAAAKGNEPNRGANKAATLPKWGGLKSGGGIARPPEPAPTSAAPPAPAPAGNYSDVEDAIEAGNNARDRKPPDYAEAERAYKIAAQLAPNDERAFTGLGNIHLDQQRVEEAVAAYRKATELNPKNSIAFENLGDAYYRLGKYQESIEAGTQSIRLAPEPPGAYWTMTWATLTVGQGETAGNMAQSFVYRWRPLYAGDAAYYITFAGYVGYREAGRTEKANTLLATAPKSSECSNQTWVCRLLKYLRHEISAEQLLSEAKDNGKLTEARTYIGIDLALSGRREQALPYLRWVANNGDRDFTEYPIAKAWLAKLE